MCMAMLWNFPVSCNSAWADFMIGSALIDEEYQRLFIEQIDTYRDR